MTREMGVKRALVASRPERPDTKGAVRRKEEATGSYGWEMRYLKLGNVEEY